MLTLRKEIDDLTKYTDWKQKDMTHITSVNDHLNLAVLNEVSCSSDEESPVKMGAFKYDELENALFSKRDENTFKQVIKERKNKHSSKLRCKRLEFLIGEVEGKIGEMNSNFKSNIERLEEMIENRMELSVKEQKVKQFPEFLMDLQKESKNKI